MSSAIIIDGMSRVFRMKSGQTIHAVSHISLTIAECCGSSPRATRVLIADRGH